MNKLIIIIALVLIPCTAIAQDQQQQINLEVGAYQQLLAEANDRLVKMSAKLTQEQANSERLKKEIEQLKKEKK